MKRIGIITMHKVLNYGSALQAWATQEIFRRTGNETFIIDYIYPNHFHKQQYSHNYIHLIARFFLHLFLGFPLVKKEQKFKCFWKQNYKLTQSYNSPSSLKEKPPIFDLYVAGSDQIWNPQNIVGDYTFFLDFAPQKKEKISVASSFAQAEINSTTEKAIKPLLEQFNGISVREENGRNIIKKILNKNCPICLDPTLILEYKDYIPLIKQSKLDIKGPFILVYILQYAYNPYPYATLFIQEAHKQTGLPVVCIDFSNKQKLNIKNCINLHDSIGPEDFVYLFSKASIVITTSYHGTAFALNFEKSVYSIINNKSSHDDRMFSLLKSCNIEERAILLESPYPKFTQIIDSKRIKEALYQHRKDSKDYINQFIHQHEA